jgi:hypothetical protein
VLSARAFNRQNKHSAAASKPLCPYIVCGLMRLLLRERRFANEMGRQVSLESYRAKSVGVRSLRARRQAQEE